MIIKSLLDQDLYSFTVMQLALHKFPNVEVEYAFKLRNKTGVDLRPLKNELLKEIKQFCDLRFTTEELDYLKSIYFLKKDFINFLKHFQLEKECVQVYEEDEQLKIKIIGEWLNTILFEVPVLAIVNELYFRRLPNNLVPFSYTGHVNLSHKIKQIQDYNKKWVPFSYTNTKGFKFADFGTRRRFSRTWQDAVVKRLKKEVPDNFFGTSNVLLAKKYDLIPVGTMSHQLIMLGEGLPNVRLSECQKYMLEQWSQEYRGDLGIALSDTLGMDAFLRDFDLYFCKLFDGARHDSGDPYIWCEKLIEHYKKNKIEPLTKTAVFSDGLTIESALKLHACFKDRIKLSFGIGTSLTNDCGVEPLQIVIKLTKVNGRHVAKLSDNPSKTMCENEIFLNYLKQEFKI